jgi:hypothetical protein
MPGSGPPCNLAECVPHFVPALWRSEGEEPLAERDVEVNEWPSELGGSRCSGATEIVGQLTDKQDELGVGVTGALQSFGEGVAAKAVHKAGPPRRRTGWTLTPPPRGEATRTRGAD